MQISYLFLMLYLSVASYLIKEKTRQRCSLVQSHCHPGGSAVTTEPRPLMSLCTAGQSVQLQITSKCHQNLNKHLLGFSGHTQPHKYVLSNFHIHTDLEERTMEKLFSSSDNGVLIFILSLQSLRKPLHQGSQSTACKTLQQPVNNI